MYEGFEVLGAVKMTVKMKVFWDISPSSLAEVDRLFIDAYCLHYLFTLITVMMETGALLPDYTAQYSRILSYLYSPP
jgi:hypothetical protein